MKQLSIWFLGYEETGNNLVEIFLTENRKELPVFYLNVNATQKMNRVNSLYKIYKRRF